MRNLVLNIQEFLLSHNIFIDIFYKKRINQIPIKNIKISEIF